MTVDEIAKRANVSKATVSRVINESGYVSKEKREKVLSVLKDIDYQIPENTRKAGIRRIHTIGVVVSEMTNPYFLSAFEGIASVADQYDIDVVFYNSDRNPEKEIRALKRLKEMQVQGIIIAPILDFDNFQSSQRFGEAMNNTKIPIVFMDATAELDERDGVFFDNFAGAFKAVDAMIQAGHREIGILTGDRRIKTVRDRFRGYCKALEVNGIERRDNFILEGDFTREGAYRTAKEYLKNGKMPQAIFTCNNFTTEGFFKAVLEEKLVLGQDIFCMAFDKLEQFDMFGLNYSYLERNPWEMGKAAMEMLLERLKNPSILCTRKIIPFHIIMNS